MNRSKKVGLIRLGSTFYLPTTVGGGGIYLIVCIYVSKALCSFLIQTVCSLKKFQLYEYYIIYLYIIYMNIIVQLLLFELTKLRTWS